jgi:hypothetical protein
MRFTDSLLFAPLAKESARSRTISIERCRRLIALYRLRDGARKPPPTEGRVPSSVHRVERSMNNFNVQACIDCSNSFADLKSPPPCFLAHGRALALKTETLVFVSANDLFSFNACYWALNSEAIFRTYALGYDVESRQRIQPMNFFDYHLDRKNSEQHFLNSQPGKMAQAAHTIRAKGFADYHKLDLKVPQDDMERYLFRVGLNMWTDHDDGTLVWNNEIAVLGIPDQSNRPNYHNRIVNVQDEHHKDVIDKKTGKPKRATMDQELAKSDKWYYRSTPAPAWKYFSELYFAQVTPYLKGGVPADYKITGGSSFSIAVGTQRVPGAQAAGITGTLIVNRKGTDDKAEFSYSSIGPQASIPGVPGLPSPVTFTWSPSWMPTFDGQIYLGMEATDSIRVDDLVGTAILKDWGGDLGLGGDIVTWYFGADDAAVSAVAASKTFASDFQVPCKAYANVKGGSIGFNTSPQSIIAVDVKLTKR